MIPKGIIIDDSNTNNLIIKTEKRALVFGDYFGLFLVFWGFFLLVLGRFAKNVDDFYYTFAMILTIILIILLICIVLTFHEYITITITNNSLEIVKRTFIFSRKTTLERDFIDQIDHKIINTPRVNPILNFRLFFGFIDFKLPRIIYKGDEIFIFQNYNKEIRIWIIDYLNSLKK